MDELPHSMIVNSVNELFVFGTTGSSDFPTTNLGFQQNFKGGPAFTPSGIGVSFPSGSDMFVSRISADGGGLLASTYVGGSGNDGLNTAFQLKYNYADEVRGEIDIDQQNNIYIATCTNSSDFPTISSFQTSSSGGQEGCVVKMDNHLTTIIWSAYLGGTNDDAIYSLALDENDDIYVTGNLGDSFTGLSILKKIIRTNSRLEKYFINKYFSPELHIKFIKKLKQYPSIKTSSMPITRQTVSATKSKKSSKQQECIKKMWKKCHINVSECVYFPTQFFQG